MIIFTFHFHDLFFIGLLVNSDGFVLILDLVKNQPKDENDELYYDLCTIVQVLDFLACADSLRIASLPC